MHRGWTREQAIAGAGLSVLEGGGENEDASWGVVPEELRGARDEARVLSRDISYQNTMCVNKNGLVYN